MKYHYLNTALNKTIAVDFPEGYAIKIGETKLGEHDLVLDVKSNAFVKVEKWQDLTVRDFYLVLTPMEKHNIIPFRQIEKKIESEQLELVAA